MTFTLNQFWKAINLIDCAAVRKSPNNSQAMSSLLFYLASLDKSEIEQFENHLSKALFLLDGESYFDMAGVSSGDEFLYCRCFVVAMGKSFYHHILDNPIDMTTSEYEPLLYLTENAWEKKTGNRPQSWDFISDFSYETGSNADQWKPEPQIQLTPQQKAEQFEIGYQRALSSVVHAYRRQHYQYVIELLSPYETRLSKKFRKILSNARQQIGQNG